MDCERWGSAGNSGLGGLPPLHLKRIWSLSIPTILIFVPILGRPAFYSVVAASQPSNSQQVDVGFEFLRRLQKGFFTHRRVSTLFHMRRNPGSRASRLSIQTSRRRYAASLRRMLESGPPTNPGDNVPKIDFSPLSIGIQTPYPSTTPFRNPRSTNPHATFRSKEPDRTHGASGH